MAKISPDWLCKTAKAKYLKLYKQYENLNEQQKDLIALMADSMDTYENCANRIKEVDNPDTQLDILKIQQKAFDNYIACSRNFRSSLKEEKPPVISTYEKSIEEIKDDWNEAV